MGIELKMPALSPTMEEGTLAKWLVKAGDSVSSGDIIAEIETDKATMEVEAIDPKIKVLLVLHPRDITDKAQFALDQFVLRGGKLRSPE